jgi:hypothetical protein
VRAILIVIISRIEDTKETLRRTRVWRVGDHCTRGEKNVGKKNENFFSKKEKNLFFILDWFLFFTSPGSLKTLNRLCSNNSAFQEDRGVPEGFSAELARDSTW